MQAGYDARAAPVAGRRWRRYFGDASRRTCKGKRIAWVGDFGGHAPCEPGCLEVCEAALQTFEALGCVVEEAQPDFRLRRSSGRRACQLRGWQTGRRSAGLLQDPAKRALLKPEAVYEIETGVEAVGLRHHGRLGGAHRLVPGGATASSSATTTWSLPTAQALPVPCRLHWPQEIAGQRMETYHEWMKGPAGHHVRVSGLAVPAGFNAQGLPIGIQIIAPNRRELDCLSLGYAYEAATGGGRARVPSLLA